MTKPGKLQGDKAVDILRYLVERRVIISMYMVGRDYERLTCVNDLVDSPKEQALLVDLPEGFKQASAGSDDFELRFTFNGPDHLEYIFSTFGGSYAGKAVKVPFPEHIERIQRRKNFRMETPVGSKLLINMGRVKAILGLVNVSLGGALGALLKHNVRCLEGSLLSMEQMVQHSGIIFPADSEREEQIIIINKAVVRRVEHDKERRLYRYAFEFTDVAFSEQKKLTESIYHFQRMFLKKR